MNLRPLSGLLALLLSTAAGALELSARVDWERRLELSTPVSGVIAATPVRMGQRVARGTVLLELDQRPFRARLARAEANLSRARENRAEARREVERTQELFDRTLLSVHDLQVAQIAGAEAEAEYRGAEADVTEAAYDLEYSRIQAPFDAWVLALPAQVGQTVVTRLEARPLVALAPVGRMRALGWADMAQLEGLSPGMAAQVVVDGTSYPGEITYLALEPKSDTADRPLYGVGVSFASDPQTLIRPGRTAVIRLEERHE
jgi:RND family efflux transporter MFP subunit